MHVRTCVNTNASFCKLIIIRGCQIHNDVLRYEGMQADACFEISSFISRLQIIFRFISLNKYV
jgi:hypothetical protein